MIEIATFGAGCFWGVEEAFQNTPGVLRTKVGYSGGDIAHPTYEDVCAGDTGHVEAVQVEFDPERVSFEALLDKFWSIHSATVDPKWKELISRQYQSVIFYHNEDQKKIALEKKKHLEKQTDRKLSTEIEPLNNFYDAEERHQSYLARRKRKVS